MIRTKKNFAVTSGFSLIELLTSITILAIMMAGAASMLDQTQKTWLNAQTRTAQFRDARLAFELITRNLSQSTLNTYWDYVYDNDDNPTDYERQSELHFFTDETQNILAGAQYPTQSIFFQAVLGYTRNQDFRRLDTLLNARGYYIKFGDDDFQKPQFIRNLPNQSQQNWRFRLMEYLPPTENNLVYFADKQSENNDNAMKEWFSPSLLAEYSRPVVDNVVALIFSPQTSPSSRRQSNSIYNIAPQYRYDSRDDSNSTTHNVLPPLVKVTLIAIDEPSAMRLEETSQSTPPNLIQSNWFQRADKFDDDLAQLEQFFNEETINYRIFSTTVAIRSAKWSH